MKLLSLLIYGFMRTTESINWDLRILDDAMGGKLFVIMSLYTCHQQTLCLIAAARALHRGAGHRHSPGWLREACASLPVGSPPFVTLAPRPPLVPLCAVSVEFSLFVSQPLWRLRLTALPSTGLYVSNLKSEIGSWGWAKYTWTLSFSVSTLFLKHELLVNS